MCGKTESEAINYWNEKVKEYNKQPCTHEKGITLTIEQFDKIMARIRAGEQIEISTPQEAGCRKAFINGCWVWLKEVRP